ncbi:MAG: hypothetical protein AAF460_09105 [Pseudomonadota bacterium]
MKPKRVLIASGLIALSGLLHIVAGVAGSVWVPVALGAACLGLALAVARNRRWTAWLGFFVTLTVMISDVNASLSHTGLTSLLFEASAAAIGLAAVALFVWLWQDASSQHGRSA